VKGIDSDRAGVVLRVADDRFGVWIILLRSHWGPEPEDDFRRARFVACVLSSRIENISYRTQMRYTLRALAVFLIPAFQDYPACDFRLGHPTTT